MVTLNPIKQLRRRQAAWSERRRFGPGVLAEVDRLEKDERLSPEEIRLRQWEMLADLLHHAYRRVPFYRRRFDEVGARPDEIRGWNDFARLPVLTREEIQESAEELLEEGLDRSALVRRSTSGTSGRALTIYIDRPVKAYRRALDLLSQRRIGYRFGDRHVYFWGLRGRRAGWTGRGFRYWLRRVRWLDAEDLSEAALLSEARSLGQWRPEFIFSYAVPLVELARVVQDAGIETVRPEAVLSTAETLGPGERRLVEDVFGCPVYDTYYTREVGLVAQECEEHRGFHIVADNCVVEVAGPGGVNVEGETGDVIITSLRSRVMPLIRYRLGDIASTAAGPCPCGRGTPRIDRLEGREIDLIRSPSGRCFHASFFHRLFDDVPGVRRWQVVQTAPEEITIRIASGGEFSHTSEERLARAVRSEDDGLRVRFEHTENIGAEDGGKYRCTKGLAPASRVNAGEGDGQ